MTTKKRWTKEEDRLLVQAITANPTNIKEALIQVSKTLDRTFYACHFRWYRVLSITQNSTKASTLFMTVGSKTVYKNRKNSSSNSTIKPIKSNLWNTIKKFLKIK